MSPTTLLVVNHLCRDMTRNAELREAFLSDPEGALQRYPRKFTDAERKALLGGDVGTLYRMGVNAYWMGYLARYGVFGLTIESYSERVRATFEQWSGSERRG
jgi:hypothetical protein